MGSATSSRVSNPATVQSPLQECVEDWVQNLNRESGSRSVIPCFFVTQPPHAAHTAARRRSGFRPPKRILGRNSPAVSRRRFRYAKSHLFGCDSHDCDDVGMRSLLRGRTLTKTIKQFVVIASQITSGRTSGLPFAGQHLGSERRRVTRIERDFLQRRLATRKVPMQRFRFERRSCRSRTLPATDKGRNR